MGCERYLFRLALIIMVFMAFALLWSSLDVNSLTITVRAHNEAYDLLERRYRISRMLLQHRVYAGPNSYYCYQPGVCVHYFPIPEELYGNPN